MRNPYKTTRNQKRKGENKGCAMARRKECNL
jgi:hypothetical protein